MREIARERGDEVRIDRERDESGQRSAAATTDLEANAGELSCCVRQPREGVRHFAKRTGLCGRLDLAQEDLELVDRATKPHHERLRSLTVGALTKLTHCLEPRKLGHGSPQPSDR